MGKLIVDELREAEILTLKFEGDIDEDVSLPEIDTDDVKQIFFDFKDLKMINSCGIRDWVSWLKTIGSNSDCRYLNCPPIIIDQINMINGFVPDNGKVDSFFVPYYCDDEDEVVLKLFKRGDDYQDESFAPPETIECSEYNGAEADIDIMPAKYFKFLKTYGAA